MKLFGTSGIRALFDYRLVELAFRVGLAVGRQYRRVVIGSDTRTSRGVLKHVVMAGLLTGGAECKDAGILPTPTLGLAARYFEAAIMITASHNPPQYNGFKLLNPDGSAFDARQQEQVEESVAQSSPSVARNELGEEASYPAAIAEHIDRILRDFPGQFKLKVVVDCGCGAASVITPHLLRKLGCEVLGINCYPSGFFPHDVEPNEANLADLAAATRAFGANLGIAHDGDADRMMAVDEQGRFIPGDKLMAVFVRALKANEIVTTFDASMSIEETGLRVRRTRVGDTYVSEELKKGGTFGGEPSGAWVFPGISLCPDGIYAAAQIVAIASQQRLSALVDAIPSYPILRGSTVSDGLKMPILEKRLLEMRPVSIEDTDGVKLGFKDGWLLVRPSGTEPKVRLTAEAKTEARVQEIYDKAMKIIADCREQK